MSNRWRHAICDACWNKKNPDRLPVKLARDWIETEKCCYCQKETASGIYLRDDPATLACKGEHD